MDQAKHGLLAAGFLVYGGHKARASLSEAQDVAVRLTRMIEYERYLGPALALDAERDEVFRQLCGMASRVVEENDGTNHPAPA